MLKVCREVQAQKCPVVVYGQGDFGEYLLTILQNADVKVTVVMDTYATEQGVILGTPVCGPDRINEYQSGMFVIASFQHAAEIKRTLLASRTITDAQIFDFGVQ